MVRLLTSRFMISLHCISSSSIENGRSRREPQPEVGIGVV